MMDVPKPAQDTGSAPGQQRRRKPSTRKQPISRAERTLSCVVQALEGRKLVVELRNDVVIRGRLEEADEYMNLSMSEVTSHDLQGYKQEYDFLYVKGRNVRFLHLPKSFNPQAAVEQQRQKLVELRIASYKAQQRASSVWMPKGDAGAAYDQGIQQHTETDNNEGPGVSSVMIGGASPVLAPQPAVAGSLQTDAAAASRASGQQAEHAGGRSDADEWLLLPQPAGLQGPQQQQGTLVCDARPQQAEGSAWQDGHLLAERTGQESGVPVGQEAGLDEGEVEEWEEYQEHPLLMTSSDDEEYGVGSDGAHAMPSAGTSRAAAIAEQQPEVVPASMHRASEDDEQFDFE